MSSSTPATPSDPAGSEPVAPASAGLEPTPSDPAPRTPTAVDAFAEDYFERLLALAPEEATVLGRPGVETEYADYSPAGREEIAALQRETLAQLAGMTPEDRIDAVTLHAMAERIGLDVALHESGRTELNNLASAPQTVRMVLELMPAQSEQDFVHIAGRLHNLPAALDGYWASLVNSAQAGQVPAQRQVQAVAEQCRSYALPAGALAGYTRSGRQAQVSSATQEALAAGTHAAQQAYQRLAQRLETELLPQAPATDAVGTEAYRLHSQFFTGTVLDLEETYRWGIEELARLVAAQEVVAEQISPGASVEEAKAILDADPARQLSGTAALQEWMQRLSDDALAALKDVHFDIPAPMDVLECMIAPTQDGGVYYTGPSDDFSRPGRMWWSVPEDDEHFTTWTETTTVYHEGVPGHHLQIATATLVKDRLNSWRRHGSFVSGFAEGWALYAEQLMAELGFLADPGDLMGMYDMQRMRAARVVFDIGVHCGFEAPPEWGGQTWTPEQGKEFLRAHLPISSAQLDFEFTRYLGWPGQAPSYKVGQRVFEELRAECEASAREAGEPFDLRAFHTELLGLGMIGLDTLRFAMRP
ncbi:DUF885 domain-containing protein [Nesterenkonia sp. E16_7]|uniref:DUF885 domain-containing protein n=1 Tax=unclassified Nesterenkonia TaxID=2629769 RepID=UPI001A91D008|nr:MULTISPECIES: DUF885 domain-containing protein [unclassified Nesterenkonia]MBO0596527.1 DUF885 domain-containing protein [Nesterenkonia sp. E16_10]MBO0597198.1 DUF885 domain-containing protein [Nesterenkonia sp. E16_7]